MRSTFIYSLNCPIFNIPKYIGKSNAPTHRLKKHIEEAKRGVKTHKCNWIRGLIGNNLLPKLEIIEVVSQESWIFWEQHYISLYKSWGFMLNNLTVGGDGIAGGNIEISKKISASKIGKPSRWFGRKHSIESRLKMSSSALGRKMKDSSKQKISNSTSHPIIQFNKNGEFIKEWKNSETVKKELGISHSACCANGKRKTAGGYIWKHKPANLLLPDRIKLQK